MAPRLIFEQELEQLKEKINKAWEEMLVLKEPETIDLKLDPAEENTRNGGVCRNRFEQIASGDKG